MGIDFLLSLRSCFGFSSRQTIGFFWIEIFFVQVKNVVHSFSEFGINRLNAPHLFQSGFCFVFFQNESDALFTYSFKSFFFPQFLTKKLSDHLLRPSGQGVHANAITSATCFSLYFLGLPGLGLSLRALWRPSSAYLFFTVKTVFLQTPNVSAISVPLFCSFARSSICALVSSLALLCPFLTKSIRKFTSQSSSFNFSIKI